VIAVSAGVVLMMVSSRPLHYITPGWAFARAAREQLADTRGRAEDEQPPGASGFSMAITARRHKPWPGGGRCLTSRLDTARRGPGNLIYGARACIDSGAGAARAGGSAVGRDMAGGALALWGLYRGNRHGRGSQAAFAGCRSRRAGACSDCSRLLNSQGGGGGGGGGGVGGLVALPTAGHRHVSSADIYLCRSARSGLRWARSRRTVPILVL